MRRTIAAIAALVLIVTAGVNAQTNDVRLWAGVAPGSEQWAQKEQTFANTPVGTVIENVASPSLRVFLPPRDKATGTGVIVAPGGSCIALVIDHEGYDVARALLQRGIAAFVLKYRVPEKKGEGIPKDLNMDQACKYGIADGMQAVRIVRERAASFGIAPNRVGFMGFSAGGMVASAALLQHDAAARPDFAALIYGAPFGVMPSISGTVPPTFMAWAKDDPFAPDPFAKFAAALRSAGNTPDVHVYDDGGHGFAMKHGKSSDRWLDDFYTWLSARGLVKS